MLKWNRWSRSAIMCYQRGGVCSGCIYEEFFDGKAYKCKMKQSVINLVQNIGAPPDIESASIYEDEDEEVF